MSFLKRWKGLYVCDLEDETQKRLSISGAEVRKKDMLIKVDLENLSEVQVSSIQGLPCHWYFPRASTGSLSQPIIQVDYLFSCTISLLQLLKQNITITFKRYYPQLLQYVGCKEEESFVTLTGYWKFYSISDCIINTKELMQEMEVHSSEWLLEEGLAWSS